MSDHLLKRFFTKAPVVFPLVALFHIGLTIFEAFNYIGDYTVSYYYWLRPVVLAGYSIFWIACCFLKKWGALGYLFLTIANVAFYFFGPGLVNNLTGAGFWDTMVNTLVLLKRALGDLLFIPLPANILFCFLILLYYQRMFPPKPVVTSAPVDKDLKQST